MGAEGVLALYQVTVEAGDEPIIRETHLDAVRAEQRLSVLRASFERGGWLAATEPVGSD